MKKIVSLKRSIKSESVLIPQVAMLAKDKIRNAQVNSLALKYKTNYDDAIR